MISFFLVFIGFMSISLSMKRHYQQVFVKTPSLTKTRSIIFRVLGFTFISIACVLCVRDQGIGIGLVYWTGLLTLAALFQSLLLTYRPQWVFRCASLITAIALTVLLLTVQTAQAAEIELEKLNEAQQAYSLYRSDIKPKLDGELTEAVWQQATVIELAYENEPRQGVRAPVKTTAYLYQDGVNLNVAIVALDPNPDEIRASLRERDNIWKDDNVGIIVDTFNDQRSGFGFFVNPMGAQADMTRQEVDDEDDAEDHSWNAIWASAGKVNENGYVVEMSIPFRALRFPDGGDTLTWNIAVHRNYLRENWVEIANYRKNNDRKCTICQYQPLIGFKGVKAGNNFQLTPTLTLGRADYKSYQGQGQNQGTLSDWQQGDVDNEVGVDLRWGISQNLVLNATLNPDFSQVEADAAQLDINNTYSLYYAEKRPFFLDGADYFSSPLLNFVHTRNIADPDYGLKLAGKNGAHRYGLMVANDNRTDFLIPGNQGSDLAQLEIESTAAIARYRMDIGSQSNIGVLMTSRTGDDYKNQLFSVDGAVWLNDSSSISYQLAHSDSKNPLEIQDYFGLDKDQSGQAYLLNFDHQTKHFAFSAYAEQVDEDFRADLGFQSDVDYKAVGLGGARVWFADGDAWLSRSKVKANWNKSWDLDGSLLDDGWELYGELKGEMQTTLELGLISKESVYQGIAYDEDQITLWAEFTPVGGIELSTFIRYGDQIDYSNAQNGTRFKIASAINWQLNQHVQLEAEYDYSYLKVDDGELYNAAVTDAKLTWQFNGRSQLRYIVQHTDVERNASLYNQPEYYDAEEQYFTTQLLYSYKINPQTLFFLGYSDAGFQDDELKNLTRTGRAVFAKFSYAWQR